MEKGVDTKKAINQWKNIVNKIDNIANTTTVDFRNYGTPSNLPDIVFCANHGLSLNKNKGFILSNMDNKERKEEVKYFKNWAQSCGYDTISMDKNCSFEGMGDAKWGLDHEVLWLGYGQRTDKEAYKEVDNIIDAEVIPLQLSSNRYYHLDLCFTILDRNTVLIVDDAFNDEDIKKIQNMFKQVLHVDKKEVDTMAGNCARITDNTIAIDKQNINTIETIKNHGFQTLEVDTSQFRKAGGSIDCLFLRLP